MGYDLTCLDVPEPPRHELERLMKEAMDSALRKTGDPVMARQAGFDAGAATGAYFRFNYVAWPKALELARFYGWESEHDAQYYLPNDGQVVSAEDAKKLAVALERAVASLARIAPMHKSYGVLPLNQAVPEIEGTDGLGGVAVGPRKDLAPVAFWADNPDKLRHFIRFARQGAFRIE